MYHVLSLLFFCINVVFFQACHIFLFGKQITPKIPGRVVHSEFHSECGRAIC